MRRAPRQPARSPAPRLDTHKRSPASLLRSTFDGLSTAGLEQMSRSRNLPLRRHHAPKPPPSQGPRGKDLCKAQRVAPWPLGNPPPRARFAGSSAKRPAPSSLGLLARRLSGGDAGGPAPTRPRGPRCSACQDGRPLNDSSRSLPGAARALYSPRCWSGGCRVTSTAATNTCTRLVQIEYPYSKVICDVPS